MRLAAVTDVETRARAVHVADYQPVRCVVEMNEGGDIAVIVRPGCSIADVQDMLGLLTLCDGQFDHLIVVDDHMDLS